LNRPIPRQQLIEPGNEVVVDPREDVSKVILRVQAGKLCRFNERHRVGDDLAAGIRAGKQEVLSPESNRTVILPISGRMFLSTTLGIRCLGGVRVAFWASSAQQARSSISS
jgi:hypothetical protein